MSLSWQDIAVTVVAAIGAITLHEAAHGIAAWALGDDTARLAGRLSLNPLRHVDRVGTILLPGFLLIAQLLTIRHVAFMFGWAKPVPVNAARFRHPRQDMALVAAAGPLMNFLLAWLAALVLRTSDAWPGAAGDLGVNFCYMFMLTNLALGLFNLLPIPPDGWRPHHGRRAAAAAGDPLGADRAGGHRLRAAGGVLAAAAPALVRHRVRPGRRGADHRDPAGDRARHAPGRQ